MPEEDLVELKFRLYDGSDIGPFRYSPASTVAMLKERIVTEWPKGQNFETLLFLLGCQGICSLCKAIYIIIFISSFEFVKLNIWIDTRDACLCLFCFCLFAWIDLDYGPSFLNCIFLLFLFLNIGNLDD